MWLYVCGFVVQGSGRVPKYVSAVTYDSSETTMTTDSSKYLEVCQEWVQSLGSRTCVVVGLGDGDGVGELGWFPF